MMLGEFSVYRLDVKNGVDETCDIVEGLRRPGVTFQTGRSVLGILHRSSSTGGRKSHEYLEVILEASQQVARFQDASQDTTPNKENRTLRAKLT